MKTSFLMTKIKIFISRELDQKSPFKKALSHVSVDIDDQSLIFFSSVEFKQVSSNWLFFYSKTGIQYFLSQGGSSIKKKIGTFGPSTADYFFRTTSQKVDFIGTGERHDVADKFEKTIGSEKVLFIVGQNSLRSVQKILNNDHHQEIIVYDNRPKTEFNISEPDIAVFTSPMAVNTYFYKYPDRHHLNIAIGNTTFEALEKTNSNNSIMSEEPTEKSLAHSVLSYLNNL